MGNGENAGYQHFLLFSMMFSTLLKTESMILATFNLLSSNALNFVQSKKTKSFAKRVKDMWVDGFWKHTGNLHFFSAHTVFCSITYNQIIH